MIIEIKTTGITNIQMIPLLPPNLSASFISLFLRTFFQLFYSYDASVLFTLLSFWLNIDYQLSFLRFRTKLFFLFLFTLRSNEQKENERATHNIHFREYFLDTSFYIWLH